MREPNEDATGGIVAGEPKTCSFTKKGAGVDPDDIPEVKKVVAIPANDIAKNELHPRVFNVIILGAIIAATDVLPMDSIKKALEKKSWRQICGKPQAQGNEFCGSKAGL